jgi:hypothetical protein
MEEKITFKFFYYLPLLIGLPFLSCKERNERIVNPGIFEVQLRSWAPLGETDYLVVYNNLPNTRYERETLTIIKTYNKEEQPSDTLKVRISKEQEDSIYYYAYKYLSNFKISNEYKKKKRPVYLDGGNLSVSFQGYEDKKLEATKYRTAGFEKSSDEASKLVDFINRLAPENFRVH